MGEEGADQEEGETHLDNDDNPLIIRCTLLSIMLIIPLHLDNDNVDNLLQISTLNNQHSISKHKKASAADENVA